MTLKELETLTRQLIDIDSTTGREGDICRWMAAWLRADGWQVGEQPVAGDRVNLLATSATPPVVILSTHLDCVPPFRPSRVEHGRVYGRGSCDAKGIAAAQIAAAGRLRRLGADVGLLFVVGEELTSDGARAANLAGPGARFLINGEPTGNCLGAATRGSFKARLVATGRAAHSAYPYHGRSAIDLLLDALGELRRLDLPVDPRFGRTHYNVGTISGGVAPNVTAPSAEAVLQFRTVGPLDDLRAALAPLLRLVSIEEISHLPPFDLSVVPGFRTAVFSYVTDIPLMPRWGAPFLLGPGSIAVAHTDEEHVALADLAEAVESYERLALTLAGS